MSMIKTGELDSELSCFACGKDKPFRMRLRSCLDIFCVECLLAYIEEGIEVKQCVRIRCPNNELCGRNIHPNDIWAVLLAKNSNDMDDLMSRRRRKELQKQWEIRSVEVALGGFHLQRHTRLPRCRQCPRCDDIYAQRPNCNFVQCADKLCATFFCWECGCEIDNVTHFLKSPFKKNMCRFAREDGWRAAWPLVYLLQSDSCYLRYTIPYLFLTMGTVGTMSIFVGYPMLIWRKVYRRARRIPFPGFLGRTTGSQVIAHGCAFFSYLIVFLCAQPCACSFYVCIYFMYSCLTFVCSDTFRRRYKMDDALEWIQMFLLYCGMTNMAKVAMLKKEKKITKAVIATYSQKEEGSHKDTAVGITPKKNKKANLKKKIKANSH